MSSKPDPQQYPPKNILKGVLVSILSILGMNLGLALAVPSIRSASATQQHQQGKEKEKEKEHNDKDKVVIMTGNWFGENVFKDKSRPPNKPNSNSFPNSNGLFGSNAQHKTLPTPPGLPRQSTSFVTAAVQAVGPSVVRIDTERTVSGSNGLESLFEDPVLKKFFGEDFQKQMPKERVERGQGSGFIVSKDGVIVTNAHVVKDAEKVLVTLTDGRSFTGVVAGTDDLLDLAVVKIETKGVDLPVATLGMSKDLQVGDWVIAIGNPLGLSNTVTLGIVSSLNRSSAEVGIPEKRINFIQTDAAINLGNSGGCLVNEFGEVVGVNTAVRANAEGIGFAIPIDRVKDIMDQLAKGHKIQHSYLGVQMVNLTPEFARQNNEDPNAPAMIPEVEGALVVRVLAKSPASEAGLRRFDIIQAMDGNSVKTAKDVQSYIDRTKVGQTISLKVVRGERALEILIKTGDLSLAKDKDGPLKVIP